MKVYGIEVLDGDSWIPLMFDKRGERSKEHPEFWYSSFYSFFSSKRERDNALRRLNRLIEGSPEKRAPFMINWTAATPTMERVKI